MDRWHFNVLFFVGVGGALYFLIGPAFGLEVPSNPNAYVGVGAILTYVLTQKIGYDRRSNESKGKEVQEEEEDTNAT